MDDLRRIERAYGSVNEYYRSMDEDSARAYEKTYEAHLRYEENKRQIVKYEQAGHRRMAEAFCDIEACFSCKNRTDTFTQDEKDDIGTFFCLDKSCKYRNVIEG